MLTGQGDLSRLTDLIGGDSRSDVNITGGNVDNVTMDSPTINNATLNGVDSLSLDTPLDVTSGGTGVATLTGIAKGNGTSAFSAAIAGTDYLAPPSGTSILKANSGGALANATAGVDYSAGTSALATGILKSTTTTGALTIAVAGDFPTLNQNTTGSAATLTTPRAIYGNNFDGSAALTQIIASTYGGTGNGFTKFSGATTTEKTYTLPDASANILTDNAVVTVAQGGTGRNTSTTAYGLLAAGTTATGEHQTLAAGATTDILVGGGASALPVWTAATGSGAPVRATSPTLVTPALGTPSSGTLTNCTGLPSSGVVGLSWAKFSGTTLTAGSGITSIANGTTGNYTVTIPTRTDANYAPQITCDAAQTPAAIALNYNIAASYSAPTTTSFIFSVVDVGGTARNFNYCSILIIGN